MRQCTGCVATGFSIISLPMLFLRVLTGFGSETVEKVFFAIDVLCSSRSSLYNLIGRSWIVVSILVHGFVDNCT